MGNGNVFRHCYNPSCRGSEAIANIKYNPKILVWRAQGDLWLQSLFFLEPRVFYSAEGNRKIDAWNIPRPSIYCRSLKKMTLPVRRWLLKRESRKAASLKPLTPEVLNNLHTYTEICKAKLLGFFQKNILNLEILWASMDP